MEDPGSRNPLSILCSGSSSLGARSQTFISAFPTPSYPSSPRGSASLAFSEEQRVTSGEGAPLLGVLPGASDVKPGEKAEDWRKQQGRLVPSPHLLTSAGHLTSWAAFSQVCNGY